jgi:L-threonylcarbamoyladenylate synthase
VITDLIEIKSSDPDKEAIEKAARVIRSGGVVAIPTDGLYALVADPFDLRAVGRVFAAKGRESVRALPMFVSDHLMAEELGKELSSRFFMLTRRFWPGPLTVIVPASVRVPLKVTGNTGRLAMRQSSGPTVQKLIEAMDQPLIGTSANMSGQPTCATGIEVFGTMDGRVDLVLDGGQCPGLGNTTVDITEPYWKMIKEGAISEKEIADCLQGT